VSGEGEGGEASDDDGATGPNGAGGESLDGEDEDGDDHKPLSDILIRDLTAHRTLGLRLALSEQPEIAIVAVTHALSAQIFYRTARTPTFSISAPQAHYWLRTRTGSRIPKRGRRGQIITPIGRRRCRATCLACGSLSWSWTMTAAWLCLRIARHSQSTP